MHSISVQHSPHVLAPDRLRATAIGRRISGSEPLLIAIANLAFGEHRRDDLAMLSSATTARVAAARKIA